jgi:small GTP-binding protein
MTSLSAPNIVVIGRSGVGKSTLINRVFGANLATTGAGKPITRYYRRYSNQHIVLFDTPGWELGEDAEASFYADTQTFLRQYRTATPTDHIHMVWYALDAPSARFTTFDASLISNLLRNYPVVLVLTKCDIARDDQKLAITRAAEQARLANLVEITQIASQPILGEPMGVEHLVNSTFERLPLMERQAFELVASVKAALGQAMVAKGKSARNHILVAAGEAAAAGAIPVPFLDIPILLSISNTMIYQIGQIYGLDKPAVDSMIQEKQIRAWIYSAVVGRSVVFELVKFIPGVGTIGGGAIDAVTCAAVTSAIGYSFSRIFREITWRRWREAGFKVDDAWVQQQLDATFQRIWSDLRHAKLADLKSYEG